MPTDVGGQRVEAALSCCAYPKPNPTITLTTSANQKRFTGFAKVPGRSILEAADCATVVSPVAKQNPRPRNVLLRAVAIRAIAARRLRSSGVTVTTMPALIPESEPLRPFTEASK